MRIAHFISNYPTGEQTQVYGKSLAVKNLCVQLANLDHEVNVFTISNTKSHFLDNNSGIFVNSYPSIFRYRSEQISLDIFRDTLHKKFDIIHLHSGISIPLLAGYFVSKKNKIPLIITWHGDSVRIPNQDRYCGFISSLAIILYKFIIQRILHDAIAIITVSNQYVNISQYLTKYREKIWCIPNGINLEEFYPIGNIEEMKTKIDIDGKKIILFLGSLYPIKGPDILLNAIPDVIKHNNNVIFVIAGDGNKQFYVNLANELNVSKYVRFTGYLNNNEKLNYLKISDVFVLPSRMESFGIVNLEAMASSLPVIATNVGGVSDLIQDKINGLLIPPNDHITLSNSIVELLKNDRMRNELGQMGKKISKNYSWKEIARQTEKLYRESIDLMIQNKIRRKLLH